MLSIWSSFLEEHWTSNFTTGMQVAALISGKLDLQTFQLQWIEFRNESTHYRLRCLFRIVSGFHHISAKKQGLNIIKPPTVVSQPLAQVVTKIYS